MRPEPRHRQTGLPYLRIIPAVILRYAKRISHFRVGRRGVTADGRTEREATGEEADRARERERGGNEKKERKREEDRLIFIHLIPPPPSPSPRDDQRSPTVGDSAATTGNDRRTTGCTRVSSADVVAAAGCRRAAPWGNTETIRALPTSDSRFPRRRRRRRRRLLGRLRAG